MKNLEKLTSLIWQPKRSRCSHTRLIVWIGVPCDFWLFPKLKKQLRNWMFSTNEDITLACDQISFLFRPPNLLKHFRSESSTGGGSMKLMVAILKKEFGKQQYLCIRTTGVLSICFCNFFLSTKWVILKKSPKSCY